jgi:hypothetical protein
MDDLSADTVRLSVGGVFAVFASTLGVIVRDFRVLLPACLATAALAFVIQHFVDARFDPNYHFMDAACYILAAFCKAENPDANADSSLMTVVASSLHFVAESTSQLLAHAASVLIDLAFCTLVLAPLLRLIATRVDSLTAYSSHRSTRQTPRQLALAWKDHFLPFVAIATMGLGSLAHGSIPGFAGLSHVPIPFSMISALIFSVAPIGYARRYNYTAMAEVALAHNPMPMLIFMVVAGPLLLFSPFTFLLLPYFVAVCSRLFAMLVTDPDERTPIGAALSEVQGHLNGSFANADASPCGKQV